MHSWHTNGLQSKTLQLAISAVLGLNEVKMMHTWFLIDGFDYAGQTTEPPSSFSSLLSCPALIILTA
jgi:hypothetical protein